MTPVTHVICRSSATAPALTVPPTSTFTTATRATVLTATAIMASVRPTSSSVSHCGDKVYKCPRSTSRCPQNGSLMDSLFVAGAKPAPGICFEKVNSAGDPYGNCGKDAKGSFAKCEAR